MYYQIPNNSDGRNNSDGWKDAWILIIAMTGIIALGVKSFNFNNSDGLNNSNDWKNIWILHTMYTYYVSDPKPTRPLIYYTTSASYTFPW